jgi:hypothetical protein
MRRNYKIINDLATVNKIILKLNRRLSHGKANDTILINVRMKERERVRTKIRKRELVEVKKNKNV